MAKKNEAKVRFLADTQDFRDGVSKANSSLTEIRSELKLNAEQMKTNGASVELLTERHRLLENELEQAKAKTENLSAQMESCVENFGENSVEAQKLATQINNAKAAEEKIQQEINKVNQELAKQASESADTRNALEKLEDTISDQEDALEKLKKEYAAAALEYGENSKEAKELAKEIKDLSGELKDNKSAMSKAEKAADDLAEEVEDAGEAAEDANDGFTVWKGTLADLASSGIQSVISGVKGLASSFWNLSDETQELRTNLGKVEIAFENSGHAAETGTEVYEDFYAVLGDEGQATEAVSHLAKLAKSQESLSDWTVISTGIYGAFGDSLPIESLTEAANETVKVGQVTGSLADALNWATMSSEDWQTAFEGHPSALKAYQSAIKKGLPVEDAFNEALAKCTSEAEREQIVRQSLLGLYSDSYVSYLEINGGIMNAYEAQARYNTALAELGAIMEPIKTVFVNGVATMLEYVVALLDGMDTHAIEETITNTFEYIVGTVFPAVQSGIQWFIDNKDFVLNALAGIASAAVGVGAFLLVMNWGQIMSAASASLGLVTAAIKKMSTAVSSNPLGLLIGIITTVITYLTYLYKTNDEFAAKVNEVWAQVQTALMAVWAVVEPVLVSALGWITDTMIPAIQAFIGELGLFDGSATASGGIFQTVMDGMGAALGFLSEIWNAIFPVLQSVASAAFDFISSAWATVGQAVFDAIGAAISATQAAWEVTWPVLQSLASSAFDFIMLAWEKVGQPLFNTISSIVNTLHEAWLIIWPSMQNLVSGAFGVIQTAWTSIGQPVFETVKSVVSDVVGFVGQFFCDNFNTMGETSSSVLTTLLDFVSNVFSAIELAWENVLKPCVLAIAEGVSNTFDAIVWAWDNVLNPCLVVIGSFIENTLKPAWDVVFGAIKDVVQTTFDGIIDLWNNSLKPIFDGIGQFLTGVFSGDWSTAWNGIQTVAEGVWNGLVTTATTAWENIKTAIMTPINAAKETVTGAVETIKGAFDFDWELPKPSLPHFSVSGGKAPWGFMGEGSLPKVSIDWYAKGAILEAPTLFGVGANGNLMGGGEAGAEAVAPIDVLLGYVRTAVADVFQMMMNASSADSALSHIESLENHLDTTDAGELSRLIDAIEDLASRPINLDIDGMRVATATAGATDSVSGSRLNLKSRGLVLA